METKKKSKIFTLLEFSDKSQQEIATLSKVNHFTVSWVKKQLLTDVTNKHFLWAKEYKN